MTSSILPKLWKNGLRTTKSRYSPDRNPIENLWAELKKCFQARRPTNLTQLHQLCQEEWAKIHPTYCGKLVEFYPKCLTQVKQFKGNATKYLLSVCTLLTHWECDGRNISPNKSFSLILF
jgi:hypothetical protein